MRIRNVTLVDDASGTSEIPAPIVIDWVSLIFWVLMFSGLVLCAWGLWKKSWTSLLISGIVLLLPTLYFFIASENWFRLLVLVPLIPFVLTYFTKKEK
ncbi:hypothetical protein ACFCYN_24065 [Gottfriedia sp. NPDC056225]|uniref:hypothetical protein n=1 Tax=Gottfriedia sp. NPDC056225 TaxID=3345751 RepID=UPI0035E025D4